MHAMRDDNQILDALTGADPARGLTVPRPAMSAASIMASVPTTLPRSRRIARFALAAAAVLLPVAIATTVYAPPRTTADPRATPGVVAAGGVVVAPVAYQIDKNPPPAAKYLRNLARQITDAPYDGNGGRYVHHRATLWGGSIDDGRGHVMGYVEDQETWTAADGSGRIRHHWLAPQFPDEESRAYWEQRMRDGGHPPMPSESVEDVTVPSPVPSPSADPHATPAHPVDHNRPPSNRTDVAKALRARYGAVDSAKWTMEFYRAYLVPRAVRADVLEILTSLDGFVWRGQVTDRAGRAGVAISADYVVPANDRANDPYDSYQFVLIFDPVTGELHAMEQLALTPQRKSLAYALFLGSDFTDSLG
jgi:hypothetical protein